MDALIKLLGFLPSHSLLFYIYGAVCVCAGILIHFYKKVIREKITFHDYWMKNKVSSIQSIIGAMFAYVLILIQQPSPDIITLIGAGYIMDSILNSENVTKAQQ